MSRSKFYVNTKSRVMKWLLFSCLLVPSAPIVESLDKELLNLMFQDSLMDDDFSKQSPIDSKNNNGLVNTGKTFRTSFLLNIQYSLCTIKDVVENIYFSCFENRY